MQRRRLGQAYAADPETNPFAAGLLGGMHARVLKDVHPATVSCADGRSGGAWIYAGTRVQLLGTVVFTDWAGSHYGKSNAQLVKIVRTGKNMSASLVGCTALIGETRLGD